MYSVVSYKKHAWFILISSIIVNCCYIDDKQLMFACFIINSLETNDKLAHFGGKRLQIITVKHLKHKEMQTFQPQSHIHYYCLVHTYIYVCMHAPHFACVLAT